MPLFFFLSGYLFTGSKYSVSDFFGKKVSKLVISYLFFTIIGVLFYIVLSRFSIHSIKHLLVSTIYWGEPSVNNNLWFLSTLTCVMTIFYFIPSLSSPLLKSYHIILVIATCLILSYAIDYIPQRYIPLKLYTVPLAFIFFFIGNRFTIDKSISRTVKICLFLGGGGISLLLTTLLNSRVDLRLNMSGNSILFMIGALSGIVVVLLLSNYLKSSILAMIGRWCIIFFPMEAYVRVIVNGCVNKIADTHYTPMLDLPIGHAIIELPVILFMLILIVRYFTPVYTYVVGSSRRLIDRINPFQVTK